MDTWPATSATVVTGDSLSGDKDIIDMKYFNPGAVVLIGYAVYASDDCAAVESRRYPVECYNCVSTESPGCDDTFNVSDPTIEKVTCKGPCAKWVRRPKYGPESIQRTCSSNLNLKLHISLVCMTESRPGDGVLCFCHDDLCNSSDSVHAGSAYFRRLWAYLFMSCIALLLTGGNWWRWTTSSTNNMQIYANYHSQAKLYDNVSRNSVECSTLLLSITSVARTSRENRKKTRTTHVAEPSSSDCSDFHRRGTMLTDEVYRTRKRPLLDFLESPAQLTSHQQL